MLITIIVIFVVLDVLLVVVVSMQSPTFRISRSTAVSASPPVLFPLVNDFHNWPLWSPWEKMDPAMTKTFDGSPAGVGAIYSWSGNKKVGQGKMTMTDSQVNASVTIKLEFFVPFKATNTTVFTFKQQGDQTLVTWTMSGDKNFVFKAMHMVMNMDKMIGTDFERGLAEIKAVGESRATPAAL